MLPVTFFTVISLLVCTGLVRFFPQKLVGLQRRTVYYLWGHPEEVPAVHLHLSWQDTKYLLVCCQFAPVCTHILTIHWPVLQLVSCTFQFDIPDDYLLYFLKKGEHTPHLDSTLRIPNWTMNQWRVNAPGGMDSSATALLLKFLSHFSVIPPTMLHMIFCTTCILHDWRSQPCHNFVMHFSLQKLRWVEIITVVITNDVSVICQVIFGGNSTYHTSLEFS